MTRLMAHDAKDDGQLQPHWFVVLRGEIDLSRAEDMRTTVDGFSASQHRSIRVDLHDVEFLDSTCVNALIDLTRVARSRGGTMTVEGARPQARRVFDVLGLSHALGIPGTNPPHGGDSTWPTSHLTAGPSAWTTPATP